jgi:transposase InsO family protein
MNVHKNARLTVVRRLELVKAVLDLKVCIRAAAMEAAVSVTTARKWIARYRALGPAGLSDRSSRPLRSPRAIAPQQVLSIIDWRKKRLTQARIAGLLGVSTATVSRVLARAGLSRGSALEPLPLPIRYEHERAGDLLHLDTKKLGRIEGLGHRITGSGTRIMPGSKRCLWPVDDHSRVGFTQMQPDESTRSAIGFLQAAVAYYRSLGVSIRRLLTDNGPAFRAKDFGAVCRSLGIKHSFTKPYCPRTKAYVSHCTS